MNRGCPECGSVNTETSPNAEGWTVICYNPDCGALSKLFDPPLKIRAVNVKEST